MLYNRAVNDAVNEQMFEFAMDCQRVIEKGWKFEKINYGEARLGIGPSLVVKMGERTELICNPEDICTLLREETIEDVFAGRTLGEVMVAGAEEFIEELKQDIV